MSWIDILKEILGIVVQILGSIHPTSAQSVITQSDGQKITGQLRQLADQIERG